MAKHSDLTRKNAGGKKKLHRTSRPGPVNAQTPSAADEILRLQGTAGNTAVSALLARQKQNTARPPVPDRLFVGPEKDRHEQEAKSIARQQAVGKQSTGEPRPPTPKIKNTIAPPSLSRAAAEGASAPPGGFEASEDVKEGIHAARGRGAFLPVGLRSKLEERLGADFSQVQVHTGAKSEQLNTRLQAKAFTHGSDIFFGTRSYQPDTPRGMRLLAHELTHVVQQGKAQTGLIQRSIDDQVDEIGDWPPRAQGPFCTSAVWWWAAKEAGAGPMTEDLAARIPINFSSLMDLSDKKPKILKFFGGGPRKTNLKTGMPPNGTVLLWEGNGEMVDNGSYHAAVVKAGRICGYNQGGIVEGAGVGYTELSADELLQVAASSYTISESKIVGEARKRILNAEE
jgi:hypothetical protein